MRFSELRRAIDGISQKMLTTTLRGASSATASSRAPCSRPSPPSVAYELTELGRDLLVAGEGARRLGVAQPRAASSAARRRFDGSRPRATSGARAGSRTRIAPRRQRPAAMNHDRYPDSYIRDILGSVKTVAIVGASHKDVRPSYFVARYLLDKGYRVFPINPGPRRQDHPRPDRLRRASRDVPEPIDMVDIFRNSEAAPASSTEALALDPQPKVDLDAARRAQRRRGGEGGSRRPAGGDEPLPEDRIRPAFRRDRLGGRELARALVEEAGAERRLSSTAACRRAKASAT